MSVFLSKTVDAYFEGQAANDNAAMRWGRNLETPIRRGFVEDYYETTGVQLVAHAAPVLLRSKGHPYMLASPDGALSAPEDEVWNLEIKHTSSRNESEWADDAGKKVPIGYYCQVQHQMAVMNLHDSLLVVLMDGRPFWRHVKRDDVFCKKMIIDLQRFWIEHVTARVAPRGSDPDIDGKLMKFVYTGPVDKAAKKKPAVLMPEIESLAARYYEASSREKSAKADKDAMKMRLKQALGDTYKARAGPYNITWSHSTRTDLDRKGLRGANPALYAEFEKKTPSDKLTVTLPKGGRAK